MRGSRLTPPARWLLSRQPPTDHSWGFRDMKVVDPDGNALRVCTRAKE
jgi:hypothetical protein